MTGDYLSNFASFEKGLNGEARSYVHDIRRRAFDNFMQLGVPTAQHEDWKYISSSLLHQMPIEPGRPCVDLAEAKKLLERSRSGLSYTHEAVLVDGFFVPELSSLSALPKGAVVGSLANGFISHPSCIQRHFALSIKPVKALGELNTAFVLDGLFIYLPQGVVVEDPIHIAILSTSIDDTRCHYVRMLTVLEPLSQLRLIENHFFAGEAKRVSNSMCEMVLGSNARCDHVRMVSENRAALHLGNVVVEQSQDSQYTYHALTLGGALVRNDVHVSLVGKGAECRLHGLDLGGNEQQIDNHVVIEHLKPFCRSSQVFKGILDDDAVGSFCGKIWVGEGAEKTDALQVNRHLLLSKNANANTRPQLEIYADDVKCSHGATVGQLDENALFYLQARGIDRPLAKSILTRAFADEIFESIDMIEMKQSLEAQVNRWLRLDESEVNHDQRI